MTTHYAISQFIKDAKAILDGGDSLEQKKAAIGERLSALSMRDDLTRFCFPLGPSDASTQTYLLWREPPYIALVLAQFDPGYLSPVHEHGDFWVIGCGYRGQDRWDIYERLDDRTRQGHAQLKLVDQWHIPPGKTVSMPRPPRAIHSHNNEAPGHTLELIFSAAKPLSTEQRLVYDIDAGACWPSGFNLGGMLLGDRYPPRAAARAGLFPGVKDRLLGSKLLRKGRRAFCPVCLCLA